MKLQDYSDTFILDRHEDRVSWYDMGKISYKEEVFRIWCETKERVRNTILAKRKRRSAKMLVRAMSQLVHQKIAKEEEEEYKRLVKENIRITAKMNAGKITSGSSEFSTLTEEGYYIIIVVLEMRKKQVNGKIRKRIEEIEKNFLGTMKEKWYSTDLKEIQELVLLIPEEERESIRKRLIQLKVI